MYMRHTLDMNAQIMPCKVSIFFFNENIFALFIMAVRCNTKALEYLGGKNISERKAAVLK